MQYRALKNFFAIAFIVIGLNWFAGLEYRGLFQPDEGRYAEIAREMLASGDFITPRLNDLKYFEKPPLQYWATAASFALFGEDEWPARLWPAITGFLGLLFLAFAGNRLGPPGSGYLAALVLASSWGYFLCSQYLTLDMGLTFFMLVTLLSFMLSQATASRGWMWMAWVGMAGAVLSKGLVGILLPALVFGGYALSGRDRRVLAQLELVRGGLLFCALTLPWFIAVQLRNPEFFRVFFIEEHFGRYLLPEHHRPGAWWYFGPILLLAMMPWTAALPGAIRRALERAERTELLLLLWVAVPLVFFSLSKSKLPAYIIPTLPALALLVARDFSREGKLATKWPALVSATLGAAALALVFPRLPELLKVDALVLGYAPWFGAAALVLVAGGLSVWYGRARHALGSFVALCLASLVSMQLALSGLHKVDERYSAQDLVERFLGEGSRFAAEAPFYSVEYFDETLPFYLGRTLTLVGHRGELSQGIRAEPEKYIETRADFIQRWLDAPHAYATMRPALYSELREAGLPMRVLAVDAWRVIVARNQDEPPLRRAALARCYLCSTVPRF